MAEKYLISELRPSNEVVMDNADFHKSKAYGQVEYGVYDIYRRILRIWTIERYCITYIY